MHTIDFDSLGVDPFDIAPKTEPHEITTKPVECFRGNLAHLSRLDLKFMQLMHNCHLSFCLFLHGKTKESQYFPIPR